MPSIKTLAARAWAARVERCLGRTHAFGLPVGGAPGGAFVSAGLEARLAGRVAGEAQRQNATRDVPIRHQLGLILRRQLAIHPVRRIAYEGAGREVLVAELGFCHDHAQGQRPRAGIGVRHRIEHDDPDELREARRIVRQGRPAAPRPGRPEQRLDFVRAFHAAHAPHDEVRIGRVADDGTPLALAERGGRPAGGRAEAGADGGGHHAEARRMPPLHRPSDHDRLLRNVTCCAASLGPHVPHCNE